MPGRVLTLGPGPEGEFTAVGTPPQWAFMTMAVAHKRGDDIEKMAALVDLVKVCVVPEERARLHDYLIEHNEAVDGLETALTDLGQHWSGRPLEQSSASSTPSPLPEPAPGLRVVSLSEGTSVQEPLPLDGQPEKQAG